MLTFLNCIQGDHATMHMKELPMFTYNLWMGCLHPDASCQLVYPVINIAMSNNFKHSQVHFTHSFSVTKLDLVIQALLLDYILDLGKKYAYASSASCSYIEINIFEHF